MKRVCIFCERWESGGIESFLYNVLTRIDLSVIRVDLVAASLGESIFTRELKERGVRFLELSGSLRKTAENFRRLRALMDEFHYDVFYLNAYQGLSLACLRLARKAGVSVRIAHSHNTALRKSPARPLKLAVHRWAKERYTREATDLWACSSSAAEFLFSGHELEDRGFRMIPNGIDTRRFRFDPAVRDAVRRELGFDGLFVVGNVGRLCYQKNQSFLLDAFAELLKKKSESRLLLIGEGEDKRILLEKAQKLKIDGKVWFYGSCDRVEHLLWAMDVFVLPSRFEGLPVTGIEAQAAGVPCVFSDAVTQECRLTDSVRFLSLSVGAEVWAGGILQAGVSEHFRESEFFVREAGFDIAQVAGGIEKYFLGPGSNV